MKALTIRQPWLALLMSGEKRAECRSWMTPYRGPLLLHAARSRDASMAGVLPHVPTGVLLATADLVDVTLITQGSDPRLFSRHEEPMLGHYAWRLETIRPLPRPVPWRGQLWLFEVPWPLPDD